MQLRVLVLILAVLSGTFWGCAPYAERYRANLETVEVPRWVRLPQADREAIAALIARIEKIETLVGITERRGEWKAFTGRLSEGFGGSSLDFSVYYLQKIAGQWRVLRRGDRISPFAIGAALSAPPKESSTNR